MTDQANKTPTAVPKPETVPESPKVTPPDAEAKPEAVVDPAKAA